MSYHVYFISQNQKKVGRNPIKIGYSNDPLKRLKALQTASPSPLRLLGSVICKEQAEARKLERSLHFLVGKKYQKLSGEWFMIYGDINTLLEQAVKMCRVECSDYSKIK